jgi:hypothetical protein
VSLRTIGSAVGNDRYMPMRPAPGRCRRFLQNATAASRLAIAAASFARERSCMYRLRQAEATPVARDRLCPEPRER